MEEEKAFAGSYRLLMETYCLSPENAAVMLERILQRIRKARSGPLPVPERNKTS